MKIVADKDIFRVAETFSGAGELLLLPGREICAEHVHKADALLVRTVTRVTRDLVAGSRLRFVGSATSGTDHVDMKALEELGITFAHASGCNADAVVNYVVAALAFMANPARQDWRQLSAGVIGAGNVGGRLGRLFARLGMQVKIFDPLLDASHPLAEHFASLEEVLRQDIVSVHVPLTDVGPFPTRHMLTTSHLGNLKQDAIFINAARGEVIDNRALASFLAKRADVKAVLDVWENEPALQASLVGQAALATPHIAGYSLYGKRNGTSAVYKEFCRYFRMTPGDDRENPVVTTIEAGGESVADSMNRIILKAYPISGDKLELTHMTNAEELSRQFEQRRNGYVFRREFGEFYVTGEYAAVLGTTLQALGFHV